MNDTKAGILTELTPGRGYEFQYFEEYLQTKLPSLSVNLPKRKEKYEAEYLFPFFSNMTPEGGNRKVICQDYRIDEHDFFSILTVMADKDCIGAVNLRKIKDV